MKDFWGNFWLGLKYAFGFTILGAGCAKCLDLESCGELTVSAFLVYIVGGIIIGIIGEIATIVQEKKLLKEQEEQIVYELIKRNEEKQKEAVLKQRQKYASDFQEKFKNILIQCQSNMNTGNSIILTPKYLGVDLQEKAWNILNDVSFNIQKLENTIEEINTKEDK